MRTALNRQDGESYAFEVIVRTVTIKEWFSERNSAYYDTPSSGMLLVWLDQIAPAYIHEEIYEGTGKRFSLPAQKLIILGLKHAGLLNMPGVLSFEMKDWDKEECSIIVTLAAVNYPADRDDSDEINREVVCVNHYTVQEELVMKRIEKFFAPTAWVSKREAEFFSGWPPVY